MTLGISRPTALWANFMVLAGWGTGMGENTPYIAIQASIESYTTLEHLPSHSTSLLAHPTPVRYKKYV